MGLTSGNGKFSLEKFKFLKINLIFADNTQF